MKGVRWTKPRVEIMSQVLDEFIKLSAQKPDLDMVCTFEYFGLKKTCSVSDDATAAIRSPYCNVLNIMRWDDHNEANTVFAREASRKITDIAIRGNVELNDKSSGGYSNYGEDAFPVSIIHGFA